MSFATDIIGCPSRNASWDSISQQPMCPETVTAGRFSARKRRPSSHMTPVAAARSFARRHVQNA